MVGKKRLQCGKLPPRMMAKLLRGLGARDPSVTVGPSVGEDTAAIALGREYLIVTSDPITLAGEGAAKLLLQVNANDLATRGVRPRYLQAIAMLPPGTLASEVEGLFGELDRCARRMGIAITGGHTEVTDAVSRPVLVGTMFGLSRNRRLLSSGGAKPGDALVMTESAGIEGTIILARSRGREIAKALGERSRREALGLAESPGTSVVQAGLIAAKAGAHAMHDPTEGGVGAAIHEMAVASRLRIEVDLDRIAIRSVTADVCGMFGIEPLGLISSGALLIAIAPGRVGQLLAAMRRVKIDAAVIGSFAKGGGVKAVRAERPSKLRWFERDELVRVEEEASKPAGSGVEIMPSASSSP